eukprot:COSAG04_NODE_238_length_19079_cov_9.187039_16_plen_256_part_00
MTPSTAIFGAVLLVALFGPAVAPPSPQTPVSAPTLIRRGGPPLRWAGYEWDVSGDGSWEGRPGGTLRAGGARPAEAVVNGSGGNHFAPDDDGGAAVTLMEQGVGTAAGLLLYSAGPGRQAYRVGVCPSSPSPCAFANGTAAPRGHRLLSLSYRPAAGSATLLAPEVLLPPFPTTSLLVVVGADGAGFRTFGVVVDGGAVPVLLHTDLTPPPGGGRYVGLGVGLFSSGAAAENSVQQRRAEVAAPTVFSNFSFVGS